MGTLTAATETFSDLLDAWAEAIVDDDAERIGAFAAADWVIVSEFGITTREGFLETVASGRLTHATMAFDVHRVAVDGDVATVIARGRNTGSLDGVPFESDEWVTEQFVRRNGRWLCSARPQGFVASSPPRSVWPERPPVSLASCRH